MRPPATPPVRDARGTDRRDERRVLARAETLDGEDLEKAWARTAVEAPEYVKYTARRPIARFPSSDCVADEGAGIDR
jgi:hypothetical protein